MTNKEKEQRLLEWVKRINNIDIVNSLPFCFVTGRKTTEEERAENKREYKNNINFKETINYMSNLPYCNTKEFESGVDEDYDIDLNLDDYDFEEDEDLVNGKEQTDESEDNEDDFFDSIDWIDIEDL